MKNVPYELRKSGRVCMLICLEWGGRVLLFLFYKVQSKEGQCEREEGGAEEERREGRRSGSISRR
jgi:hypothetical protein